MEITMAVLGDLRRSAAMPLDFTCDDCGLRFTTGWFHHAGCIDGAEYFASSQLVCTSCGAQHGVDHAETLPNPRLSVRAGELSVSDLANEQHPDRLTCLDGPTFCTTYDEAYLNSRVLLESVSIRPIRRHPNIHAGLGDKINTRNLRCGHCDSVGTLTVDWYKVKHAVCPHCGGPMPHEGAIWMT